MFKLGLSNVARHSDESVDLTCMWVIGTSYPSSSTEHGCTKHSFPKSTTKTSVPMPCERPDEESLENYIVFNVRIGIIVLVHSNISMHLMKGISIFI